MSSRTPPLLFWKETSLPRCEIRQPFGTGTEKPVPSLYMYQPDGNATEPPVTGAVVLAGAEVGGVVGVPVALAAGAAGADVACWEAPALAGGAPALPPPF